MATAFAIDTGPLNRSGLDPLDKRVLVKKDSAEEKVGSILLPPSEVDKKKFAMTKATVIAVGQMAWAEPKYDAQQWGMAFDAPEAGSRVRIGKYTGDNFTGDDGEEYTIINDADVIGLIRE